MVVGERLVVEKLVDASDDPCAADVTSTANEQPLLARNDDGSSTVASQR
jgi:hypothetical protein